MNFSVTFELSGTQALPLTEYEKEKLETKVYTKLKNLVEVVVVDNHLVLRKKSNTLAVDLVP